MKLGLALGRIGWAAAGAALLLGCGSKAGETEEDEPAPPAPRELEYEARDYAAPTFERDSNAFCVLPKVELGETVPLDRQLFIDTFSDYAVGWMAPLHEGLLGLDEQAFLDSSIEAVASTFVMACRTVPDYEIVPGEDEPLIDPQVESDFRQSLSDWIEGTTVVPTDDGSLRLEIYECEECGAPIGVEPSYVVVRLGKNGLLAIEYELRAGESWTKKAYVTPDAVVLQGELGPLSSWSDGLTKETREGSTHLPDVKGQLTVLARKLEGAGLSLEIGVKDFEFTAAPGEETESRFVSQSPCLALGAQLDSATGSGSFGLRLGTADLTLPGKVNCNSETSCGEAERTGAFTYHSEGLVLTASDPETGSTQAATFGLKTGGQQQAAVNGEAFGEFGLAADEGKGNFSVDVTNTDEGLRVVFEPALDLHGALTISAFSDAFRAELPDWLSDEVFDISFGGEAKPSLLVPHRQLCDDNLPEPTRRLVKVERGTVTGDVGDGRHSVTVVDQCLAKTQAAEATLAFSTDWVESGLTCE